MKSPSNVAAMNRLRAEAGNHAHDAGRCRILKCGGPLRIYSLPTGVIADICERCETRAERAEPLEAAMRSLQAQLAGARLDLEKALQREGILKARVSSIEEHLGRLRARPRMVGIDGTGTAGRVFAALRAAPGPLSCPELAALLPDVRRAAIQVMLSALCRRGAIARVARGKYAPPTGGQAA